MLQLPQTPQLRSHYYPKVKATDADGTQPGNLVKYKVEARSNKAADYFGIDPNTGVITLLGDLTMEVYDEYKLEVLAHDMGKQNLTE